MRAPWLIVALGLCCVIAPAGARAQDAPVLQPTVLIVDSSASMSGRVGGRIKLDAAREVILESLSLWRADSNFALLAYGHRRAGDCADIETLMPMAPLDLKTAKTSLDGLRARGKTPLAESLRQASEELPPEGGAIVLVSDGLETCEADPCLVASQLHRDNPAVSIQVIGYGVTEEERQGLSCIAAGGGGRLFAATDAAALTEALQVIGAVAGLRTPEQLPADPAATATLELRLVASEGDPLEENEMAGPVAWTVEPLDKPGPIRISDLREPRLAMVPGRYRVAARFGEWTGEALVEVAADSGTVAEIDLRLGRVVLELASDAQGPALEDVEGVSWEFARAERPELFQSILSIARPMLVAQEGEYLARVTSSQGMLSAPATVIAGETTVVRVVLPEAPS